MVHASSGSDRHILQLQVQAQQDERQKKRETNWQKVQAHYEEREETKKQKVQEQEDKEEQEMKRQKVQAATVKAQKLAWKRCTSCQEEGSSWLLVQRRAKATAV